MSTTYFNGSVVFRNERYTDMTQTFRVTTSSATPYPVYSVAMMDDESCVIECRFIGRVPSGNDVSLGYTIMVNSTSGVVTIYGSDSPMLSTRDGTSQFDDSRLSCTGSGNTVTINIIGLPATSIDWAGTIRTQRSTQP
jgi:hypothetical protein